MNKADEFFEQWLRMRSEFFNSAAYKKEQKARKAFEDALQGDIDEQYPGKKLDRWRRAEDKNGNPVIMVTFKK
jgi:hypothetical protein